MPDAQPVTMSAVPLPWYRESAFRVWVKATTATLGAALIGFGADISAAREHWMGVLLAWLAVSAGHFAIAVPDIFFLGPDTFVAPPPPPPPAAPSPELLALVAAAVKAELAKGAAAPPAPPAPAVP